jgi:rhodanese-related sulfurtransferase
MEDMTTLELKMRMKNEDPPILIDVREPYEHEDFNIGGELIPLGTLLTNPPSLQSYDKHAEIAVYCRSGVRSGTAKQILKEMGYNNVRNLIGGMIQWQSETSDTV